MTIQIKIWIQMKLIYFVQHLLIIVSLQKSSIFLLKKFFSTLQNSSIFSLKIFFSILQNSSMSLSKIFFSTYFNMLRTMKFKNKNLMFMRQIRKFKRFILKTMTILKKIFVAILKHTISMLTTKMRKKIFLHISNLLIIIWKTFRIIIINFIQ